MTKFFNSTLLVFLLSLVTIIGLNAQQLDIPVMERASDDLDTCAYGQVVGLKADGDGFLAVRKGPNSNHQKIDELRNFDKVWLFDEKDGWIGIVYSVTELSCSPIDQDRPVQTNGKKGWVFGKWIEVLAG